MARRPTRRTRAKGIFTKVRVNPRQLRTVADRRYDDADCLRQTGQNARATGAMYLGGYVIECLLKARLLEKCPQLQSAGSPGELKGSDRYRWSLCYRRHDLDELLNQLPEITVRLASRQQRATQALLQSLRQIAAQWTVFARYSPQSATTAEANQFLARVKELKTWLR